MTVFQLMEMYRKIGEYLKPLALKIPVFAGGFGSPLFGAVGSPLLGAVGSALFGANGSAFMGSGLAVSGQTVPKAAITPDLTREESAALRFTEAFFPTTEKYGSDINSAGKASPISFSANSLPKTVSVLYTVPLIGETSPNSRSGKGLNNIQLGKNAYAAALGTGFAKGRSVSGEMQSAFPRSAVKGGAFSPAAVLPDFWERTENLRYSYGAESLDNSSSNSADYPERLRTIRGIAGRKYGTAEVRVDMSGMQNIVSSKDDMNNIDELIDRLCGAFSEAAYSMAEGVHY